MKKKPITPREACKQVLTILKSWEGLSGDKEMTQCRRILRSALKPQTTSKRKPVRLTPAGKYPASKQKPYVLD